MVSKELLLLRAHFTFLPLHTCFVSVEVFECWSLLHHFKKLVQIFNAFQKIICHQPIKYIKIFPAAVQKYYTLKFELFAFQADRWIHWFLSCSLNGNLLFQTHQHQSVLKQIWGSVVLYNFPLYFFYSGKWNGKLLCGNISMAFTIFH